MSKKYTPTNWVANKTVATADAMNNIEKGIEDAHQDIEILDLQVKEKANKVDLETQKARIEILDSQVKDKASNSDLDVERKRIDSVDSQIKEKADKAQTNSLQSQINNLVLQSGGDSNLEVVQSRTNSVGSIFFNLKNHIDNIEKAIFNKIDRKYRYKWAIGTTDITTGGTNTNLTRITTDEIIYADEDLKVSMSDYNTYKFGIRQYPNYPDLTNSFDNGWILNDITIPKGTYFRLNFSKIDGTEHNMQDAMTGELFDAISILDEKTIEYFLTYDIKQIDNNVKTHNLINSRYSPLKLRYDYIIGSLPSSGIVDTNRKFRISTPNKILADKEIVGEFDIINYKYWILYFDEDNNWLKTDEFSPFTKNNKTIIPANSIFMITMGRASNDTSEVFTSVYNDVFDGFSLTYSDNSYSNFDDIKKNKEEIENIKKNGIGIVVNEKNANVLATAHRGYSKLCPENTMVSYKTAYKEGFRILETDVKKTSDGVLVLLHDNTLNNTARNSDGTELTETINIADITYEQANQYDYGVYKGAEFAGEKLPKLEELLLYAKKTNCNVHIDGFASNLIGDIFQLVEKLGMKDHVMWSSFIKSDLTTVLGLDAKATVIYNYSGDITNSIIDDVATLKTDLNEVYFAPYFVKLDANLGFIDYVHYKNIKIIPYAVDDETKILTYVNAGIDGICTNGTNIAKIMIENS